jgi:hypothetical protein
VKRVCSILLIVAFAGLASGVVEYLHNLQHAEADSAQVDAAGGGLPQRHDDSNCDLHRRLHMPALADQWVPLLVFLGFVVAFLTLLSPRLAPQMAPACVACRGPPVW